MGTATPTAGAFATRPPLPEPGHGGSPPPPHTGGHPHAPEPGHAGHAGTQPTAQPGHPRRVYPPAEAHHAAPAHHAASGPVQAGHGGPLPVQISARLAERTTNSTTDRSSRRRFALAALGSSIDKGNHWAGRARASSLIVLPAAASGIVGRSTRKQPSWVEALTALRLDSIAITACTESSRCGSTTQEPGAGGPGKLNEEPAGGHAPRLASHDASAAASGLGEKRWAAALPRRRKRTLRRREPPPAAIAKV
eukprot:scaffold11478_cov103-Isochrysis_galbana.AAC.4